MIPEISSSKRAERLRCIPHEATGGVRIHGEQERNEEVVGVPKGLVALLSDFGMRGGVDQEHTEQHDVPGDSTGLRIMNLHGGFYSHL